MARCSTPRGCRRDGDPGPRGVRETAGGSGLLLLGEAVRDLVEGLLDLGLAEPLLGGRQVRVVGREEDPGEEVQEGDGQPMETPATARRVVLRSRLLRSAIMVQIPPSILPSILR